MSEKELPKTNGKGGARPNSGRPKGVPNKTTTELKQMILDALSQSGGVEYLVRQAEENPKAFISLLGRVLPLQVTGKDDGPITIHFTSTDAGL